MHTHRHNNPYPLIAAMCAAAATAALGTVPIRWTVETSHAGGIVFEQFSGSTISLEAALQSYGKPLEVEGEPRLYWQTNGMGSAYWSAPASVSGNVMRATWRPAMETGARAYQCFVGVPGSIYSAAFQLRLRPSPGAMPNALPLPVPRIDFATVEVANAPWASAAEVASLSAGFDRLGDSYVRLFNFMAGATNANFSATNYPPTKAESDARCHYEPEPWMDFSTVPASLQLNEFRDGEWRTVVDTRDWTVWYFRSREALLTNEIALLKAENAALSARIERESAWGDRTANGVENPMPDTLVVDRPNMWLMAGYEWQKCVRGSNQCFVLRAKDIAISGGASTNGFLEICDAFGKPYMRINKSAETFADPIFSETSFDEAEGAWYIVFGNSTKPTRGGANAAIAGNGAGKFILFDEDDPECPATITWPETSDSHAGHWIMRAVPKPIDGVIPEHMFFGAEIKVAGRDYVEYIKEASFGAGVRVGNNVYDAVESGNNLIWVRRND